MSIFLSISDRYGEALETFDPFPGEWLLRIVDPWPRADGGAKLAWGRLSAVAFLLIAPAWLFSAVPSKMFGRSLVVSGSLSADVGYHAITFFVFTTLALIPIARRAMGALINDLIRRRTMDSRLRDFSPTSAPIGRLLRSLEWLSRLTGFRFFILYLLMLAGQLFLYHVFLTDKRPTWQTSPAEPGTFFYALRIGSEQPNLAGLWSILILSPIGLYLVLLVARLFVVFACLCSELAQKGHLRICPSHPDTTGGLLPIGQVALLLSLFTFTLGIELAGMTANEYVLNVAFPSVPAHAVTNLQVLVALWIAYIVMGTILFFLPLLPLRRRMAAAKREYLLEANDLHLVAERKHEEELRGGVFNPDSLQGLVALDALIESGTQMVIWPFDQRTLFRYAGLLIAPLTPVIIAQLPHALRLIQAYGRLK